MTAFKPMLAKDADPAKLIFPLMGQVKLDGIRASVVNGKLVSRTLKPIPNAEIREALERPEFEGFDGEILVGPVTAEDCYRRTASFVMAPNKTGEDWNYFVFDKWNHPGDTAERINWLEDWERQNRSYLDPVCVVATTPLPGTQALEEFEEACVSGGHEGVILRDPRAPYKFGRSGKSGPLLKLKRYVDFEAEVIGVYEEMHNGNEAKTNALGRTERSTKKDGLVGKGTLGGFIVRAINGPAEGVEFKVGTGFDAHQRAEIWQMWHSFSAGNILQGATIKVKSFPIGVKDKPRHPVFLGFRDMEIDG